MFVFSFFLVDLLRIKVSHGDSAELPSPTAMLKVSENYSYPLLLGVRLDPENPLKIDFIIDQADKGDLYQEEASLLVRYFLASLTLPEDELWVNLSPYESDRIIPEELSLTEMGRDMLAQDYVLKQLASTLTYPEDKTGKQFWKSTYDKVVETFGTLNIPVDTFNKVWILPKNALVYESNGVAVIKEATLKVMMEADYSALQKNRSLEDDINSTAGISSDVMRDVVIPEIEKDVNYGRNFARLRQIYHSLVLGKWFKEKFRQSFYHYYTDQKKISGVDTVDTEDKEAIYRTYVEAFEKGCYDYIKKEYDPGSGQYLRKRYFSGGVKLGFSEGNHSVAVVSPDQFKKTVVGSAIGSQYAWLSAQLSPLSGSTGRLSIMPLETVNQTGPEKILPVVSNKFDIDQLSLSSSVEELVLRLSALALFGLGIVSDTGSLKELARGYRSVVAVLYRVSTDRGTDTQIDKSDTKGGIDLAGIDVGQIESSSALMLPPFDAVDFSGFDFDIVRMEKYDSADAMLASFL